MPAAYSRLLLAVLALCGAGAADAAGVRQFTPQGEVDQALRASALFSADMVPLGRPASAAPFAVDCGAVKGQGRWSDTRRWSYTLERPLRAGERCDFRLLPELRTYSGQRVTGDTAYTFFAPGPWPSSLTPAPGAAIEEDQAFVVDAGQALALESVARNVWCEADGVGQRIPVSVVAAASRDEILATLQREASPATLVIACSERLPSGARMRLVWGAGVATQSGARASRAASFAYRVRAPFHASVSCEREKPAAPCSPLADVQVEFSSPVDVGALAAARLALPGGKRLPSQADSPAESLANSGNTTSLLTFRKPLPEHSDLVLELPATLRDEAGRALDNAASFPLSLRTGGLPPLAKFPGAFGIVERKEGGVIPVTLRNVEASLPLAELPVGAPSAHRFAEQRLADDAQVIAAMRELARFERQTRQLTIGQGDEARAVSDPYYARELSFLKGKAGVVGGELPKPGGSGQFEVVGIPLAKPGYHIVEIESRQLGAALLASAKPMYVRSSVLVTNLAVHLKRGRDNALVWVTALDSGKPVAGADVRVSDCAGQLLWQGRSDSVGRALVDRQLPEPSCQQDSFYFASARLDDDYSFVRSDWNDGIEPWRFGVDTWGDGAARKLHTIVDRTLLRAGQTVSMKHLARERGQHGFAFPAADSLPGELVVRHEGSGDEFRQPLVWDARGVATSQWAIPPAAKRGRYQIELASAARGGAVHSGGFSVADFRVPAFTGSVQGVAPPLVASRAVALALALSYLDGGAAKGARVEVSATLRARWPQFKGYDDFRFAVDFDEAGRSAFAIERGPDSEQLLADRLPVTLDQAGAGRVEVALPRRVSEPGEVYAEMSFADPNGEVQTVHGSVDIAPAAVATGIRVRDWVSLQAPGQIEVVVVDAQGRPVADAPVSVVAKRRVDFSHRKRIVGGFYAYDNRSEFTALGEICQGRSDARGRLLCTPDSSVVGNTPGNVYLLAQSSDRDGNRALAGTSLWLAGNGDAWFAAGNQERIDVLPDKHSYAPGETARLLVHTPFREATALVAVEAGGVIETQVLALSRLRPVIELPVKGDWGPNVFVSVLLVRGRVQPLAWYSFFRWGWREPLAWLREWWAPASPTAMVDLAKPAYKLGLARIGVGVDAFRLKVAVAAEQSAYQPRQTAQVKVSVTLPDGRPAPAGTEVAFAAVDQALLELRPNDSWALLDAMLPTRAYLVETATAQSQVIGKRHFGKKAVPVGGGGGRAPARELFDTLLLWQPRVRLDANGSATLRVPLNDTLGEFALVAVADSGAGLFGSGRSRLRTRQDLQLISGLPPALRESDRFRALLTVRNATAQPMRVNVTARTQSGAGERLYDSQALTIEAQGAAELHWPGDAPPGASQQTWEFAASAEGVGAEDRLRVTQQIVPAVPLTVQQASLVRLDGRLEIPLAAPADAIVGVQGALGGVELALSARLSTPPPGLRRFFTDYPYSCLEQRVSVAAGLRDAARWQQVVDELPTYLDANGLARYFPETGDGGSQSGSTTLTAYLLDASHAAGLALPPPLAQRMERGLAAFAEGRIKPAHWAPQSDLLWRKLAAIEALTRRGGQPLSALASLEIDAARLPSSALIDWYLIAKRLVGLPQRAERLAGAERELRKRLSYLGGRLVLASEGSDYLWWLMVSGDANAFRLIEAVADDPGWRDDLPALLQGAMLRQQRGRWATTVANLWASVVLERFGEQFEHQAVSGNTQLSLGALPVQNFAWPTASDEPQRQFLAWPAKPTAGDRLQLVHQGGGRPWVALQTIAAVPVKSARGNGLRVTRELTALQQKQPGAMTRGDVWRVRLKVSSDQEMSWVVVDDPVAGGARIVDDGGHGGEGGGRDARLVGAGERASIATVNGGEVGKGGARRGAPSYVERTFSAYRAYFSHVPRGEFFVDYTLRLNNAGEYSLPATRVEAMYAPEVFGEAPNAKLVIAP